MFLIASLVDCKNKKLCKMLIKEASVTSNVKAEIFSNKQYEKSRKYGTIKRKL